MSIVLPFVNHQFTGAGAVRLDIPITATVKPANQACVYGLWIRSPSKTFEANRIHTFLGQQTGGTGGGDGYIRFNDQAQTTIETIVKDGGATQFQTSVNLGASAYDKPMLIMMIVDNGFSYLVACEVGGSPVIGVDAGATLYGRNMNTATKYLFNRLGSALSSGFYGAIENAFLLYGSFPGATTNTLDTTLIQNIANGIQDLDTLDAQLTAGSKRFRYKLQNELDLADSWGVAGDLTPALIDTPKGFVLRTSGPLRPTGFDPNRSRTQVSQCVFPTPGSAAGAVATIKTEGGTYSGITPANIQARLLNDANTEVVGWTTVDAAPAGGVWAPGQLTDVPLTAGFLRLEFRAIDGAGRRSGRPYPVARPARCWLWCPHRRSEPANASSSSQHLGEYSFARWDQPCGDATIRHWNTDRADH
jgi:hypothetical protein